ncbi:MAG: aldehyde ferredoxin oxidoreductase family protein [Deltaproteobacteria bacterium]|nr:aldehyde ferredoxin oxidoreductase family protein [Deltaproteobacteria bacterium]MBN2687955.1 aldehyde ferredoxin oxidoreductase family protein [Deltaproteobacteria bacterium]
MPDAYMGSILRVDLSGETISEERIPDSIYENYLSGLGLAAYILFKEIPAGADPLGPDNILGFVSGLLTGTGSLFAGRWMVTGKSPLTGGWGDANCGGTFSPAIKRCGYDGIFIRGISENPVYLYVTGEKAELRDASHVWGKDAVEAEKMLVAETGPRSRVALIGEAGEKRSLISGICNDGGRIAARSGLGAVMGSKRLKAVVLNGAKRIPVHDRDAVHKLSGKCGQWVRMQSPLIPGGMMAYLGAFMRFLPVQMALDGMLYKMFLRKWGTGSMNQMSVEMGDAPVKNWLGSHIDFTAKKSAATNPDILKQREIIKYHCYACPLGCGGICSTKGKYARTHKPEYESVIALGGLCMNNDIESIFYLNELLNRAGMDTISAGATVAFAIECYESGVITRHDTGGLELTWGNSTAIVELVRAMIRREGIGDILADGSRKAAERIGGDAKSHAVHAGGQEPGMHDGRDDPGYALHYSVEPTPGRHTIGSFMYYEMFQLWKVIKGLPRIWPLYMKGSKYTANKKKAVMGAACSRFMNVVNGAGLCLFGTFLGAKRIPTFDWINAATGWSRTPEEYMEIGGRIQTVKQLFNIKHGIEPNNFLLTGRATGDPPLVEGANAGRTVDIKGMIRDYWKQFGWDEKTGKPTAESVIRSGIRED